MTVACRILFERWTTADSLDSVKLTVNYFNLKEIIEHFKVFTVNPRIRDAFNSHHDGDYIRRLTTKEYYHTPRSDKRMENEDIRKVILGIRATETNTSSVKTTSREQFVCHIQYVVANMPILSDFYSFRVVDTY